MNRNKLRCDNEWVRCVSVVLCVSACALTNSNSTRESSHAVKTSNGNGVELILCMHADCDLNTYLRWPITAH